MNDWKSQLEFANGSYRAALRDLALAGRTKQIVGLDFFFGYFDEILSICLLHFDARESATVFLNREQVIAKLQEFLAEYKRVHGVEYRDQNPPLLDYRMSSIVHLCWFLNQDILAEKILPPENRFREIKGTSPEFVAYGKVLSAFGRKISSYKLDDSMMIKKPKARHRLLYMRLMEAYYSQGETVRELAAIDEAFNRTTRKKEKSGILQWDGLDECPEKWDLRKESILSFAARNY